MLKNNFSIGDAVLDHIGIVVKDIESTSKILSSLFNIGPWSTVTHSPNSDLMIVGEPYVLKCSSAKIGQTKVELLEPIDNFNSVWGQALAKKGGGAHHIAFRLKNLSAKTNEMKSQGWKMLVHARLPNRENEWCYMEKDDGEIIVELMDFGV